MRASASDYLGAPTTGSTGPVIEASPRRRILRRTSSYGVPESVGMTRDRGDAIGIAHDRGDAVVFESDVISRDKLAEAMDTASPAAAVTAETQQEHDMG